MKIVTATVLFFCLAQALLACAGHLGANDNIDLLDDDADYEALASDGDIVIIASDGDPEEALAAAKAYPPLDLQQLRLDAGRDDRVCPQPVSMEDYFRMMVDAPPVSDFDVAVTCGPVYHDE
ncbi:hypothetical protein PSEUBRA_006242 [Kalmanozyma brasiliensis GHG001]|uniref:uncharacterized protein n=1 Tax=Kalmanozyma brasiliensis (strain GHG001) TaxID=1365824 RepID=UPI0028681A21|nr:uncharacterized protein PSEUBRA_006242 [Kalmanozyma brasiliensis GHG001]KAF6767649.1 hypothetical protein PSEUBRA_006242 [Kalmanozyma brasiliensis GHG001]